ncbi:MAG TPA: response regulator [Bacteriovoracaceae bacterium]|nr:response regulator [Bacteriovoracaceae bacterium]
MECKSILVIDDDPAILQTMQDVLEIHGFRVHTAVDGADGIRVLQDMVIPPCVVLLDLMMPGMNGWGFLDYQKGHPVFSKVPVVLCSAYEASARSVGKEPVLIKPVKLDTLLAAVKVFCA